MARRKPLTEEEEALVAAGIDIKEAQQVAGAPDTVTTNTTQAAGYVTATHPDTGLTVVFVPGERLPVWATP